MSVGRFHLNRLALDIHGFGYLANFELDVYAQPLIHLKCYSRLYGLTKTGGFDRERIVDSDGHSQELKIATRAGNGSPL